MLAGKRFEQAQIGIKVVSLADGESVFERNAAQLFHPASNAKLFTAALVLDRLDPERRIQTSAYGTVAPDGAGRVDGDLVVYGRGDPSLAPRYHRGDARAPFREFATAIHRAGLRQVAGDLIADESYFNAPPFGTGWTWDELGESYAPEVSALSVHDNYGFLNVEPGEVGRAVRITTRPRDLPFTIVNRTVTAQPNAATNLRFFRPFQENRLMITGSLAEDDKAIVRELTVRRPALWFGEMLRAELEELGVRIDGSVRALNWHERLLEPRDNGQLHYFASASSPPIKRLTEVMMKESDNLHAQLLLLQVGALHPAANIATDAAALAELGRFLRECGVDADEVRLEEGSGLSRRARVTPAAIVRLLVCMRDHPRFEAFREALPLAGVDGTLAGRFKGTAAQRNLRAKTGSLNEVKSLSGYVKDSAGREYAFSVLLNNHRQSGASAKAALDALVAEIAH